MTPRVGPCLALALIVSLASPAGVLGAPTEEDLPPQKIFDMDPSGVKLLRVAVPRAEGDAGAAAVETMSKDMDVTGLFQVLDPASFPSQLQSEGLNFSSALWTQVGAQVVIKMKAAGGHSRASCSSSRAETKPPWRRPTATPTSATPSTSSRTTSCNRRPATAACSAPASCSR